MVLHSAGDNSAERMLDPTETTVSVSESVGAVAKLAVAPSATLMLRMYGIPARYVSGFVIEPEVLQQETENGWEKT